MRQKITTRAKIYSILTGAVVLGIQCSFTFAYDNELHQNASFTQRTSSKFSSLTLTIVYDNYVFNPNLTAAWGFSWG